MKKKWIAAITVPGLVLGGTAVAGAQTADDDATTDENTVEDGRKGRRGAGKGFGKFAEALGLEGSELREALAGGQTLAEIAADQGVDIDSVIDDIVANAQARADENPDSPRAQNFDAEAFEARLTEMVNTVVDPSDFEGRRGHRGPRGGGAIAEALGLEPSELRDALTEGQTIADVAAAQGVDIDGVIDQIVADVEARIAENPDSPRAQNFDAEAFEEKLTERVNTPFDPDNRPDRPGRGFRGGPRGPQADSGVDA